MQYQRKRWNASLKLKCAMLFSYFLPHKTLSDSMTRILFWFYDVSSPSILILRLAKKLVYGNKNFLWRTFLANISLFQVCFGLKPFMYWLSVLSATVFPLRYENCDIWEAFGPIFQCYQTEIAQILMNLI